MEEIKEEQPAAEVGIIKKYFPEITEAQLQVFAKLRPLYSEWNEKINVVSRKDIEHLYERHVLHSLAIAQYFQFAPNDQILDVGTGGGFPGIPLAIMFPETKFHLVDSIGKKIKVVQGVKDALNLANVTCEQARVETLTNKYDFVVTRAVAEIATIHHWVRKLIKKNEPDTELKRGIIALKGGDLKEEFKDFKHHVRFYDLSEVFEEEFFETKKVVYVVS